MSQATERAVAETWSSSFPHSGGDPDATFAEEGGDSLLAMKFVHALSLRVGRELALDVVGMDSTRTDVAKAVEVPPGGGPDDTARGGSPVLVLVSGAYGDEPGLAELRRMLVGVDVLLVEPPGTDAPDRVLWSMSRMAAVVVDAVGRCPPGVPVHLAGFSFGGALAVQAAAMLEARGEAVASLSVIDAPLSSDAVYGSFWIRDDAWRRASWTFQTLPGRWRPARVATEWAIGRLCRDQAKAYGAKRRLLHPSRSRVLRDWKPPSPGTPTLMIFGEGLGEGNASGWASALPRSTVVRVPGGHGELFKGANLRTVSECVITMVEGASRTVPTGRGHEPPVGAGRTDDRHAAGGM